MCTTKKIINNNVNLEKINILILKKFNLNQ